MFRLKYKKPSGVIKIPNKSYNAKALNRCAHVLIYSWDLNFCVSSSQMDVSPEDM
jgi:hypothetical protein